MNTRTKRDCYPAVSFFATRSPQSKKYRKRGYALATDASVYMTIFNFGTVTETQDGYTIEGALGNNCTITIDGDQATIVVE